MRKTSNYHWTSRLDRALTQRIYLMRHEEKDNHYTFLMMGNSGKPYSICIKEQEELKCSCPDHSQWHNFCKHLICLLVRVIGISRESIFRDYFENQNFKVTPQTFQSVSKWFKTKEVAVQVETGQVKRKEIENDDDCPVCYENFRETKGETTVWCKQGCGKSVHETCFLKWCQATRNKSDTCVWCRTEWIWK